MAYRSKIISAILLASTAFMSTSAYAADVDEVIFADDANFVQPAELGSGWYLRGEVGLNINRQQERIYIFDDATKDDFQYDFGNQVSAGIGAGYQFNSMLRGDITLDRQFGSETRETYGDSFAGVRTYSTQNQQVFETTTYVPPVTTTITNPFTGVSTSSTIPGYNDVSYNTVVTEVERDVRFNQDGLVISSECNNNDDAPCPATGSTVVPIGGESTDTVAYTMYSVLANGYVDLPKFAGFSPYLGGGLGVSRGTVTVKRTSDCITAENEQCLSPAGEVGENVLDRVIYDGVSSRWLPTASVAAGLSYDVSKNMKMDLGYKYTHVMGVNSLYKEAGITGESNLGIHSVRLGLRFATW